jgi:hypothetical protein
MLDGVTFVALPVDVATLPRQRTPVAGNEYARIPRARVLDVISMVSRYPFTAPLCRQLVHRNFDRYRARLMRGGITANDNYGIEVSIHRKVVHTRADGRKILQHTRTSNADLFRGQRTPGQLP